jgi:hypothetical protein
MAAAVFIGIFSAIRDGIESFAECECEDKKN